MSSTSVPCLPTGAIVKVTALPRQPAVVRDLSILIDAGLPAASVPWHTIRANAPATLEQVREFDRYEGKGVPEGQVGLSIRLTFRDQDRTLTDAEVQQAVETIVTRWPPITGRPCADVRKDTMATTTDLQPIDRLEEKSASSST